jgi:Penicillin binding protein transpeptidase domain/NTF2-like N-terminal transpeptidase domain
MRHDGSRRSRRVTVVVVVTVLVIALGGAAGWYLLLRTKGSPRQTAASYLADWQRGRYTAMNKISQNVPPGGLAAPLTMAAAQLGARQLRLTPGAVTIDGGTAQAQFTASFTLTSGHVWTYRGLLRLVKQDRQWWVSWSPAAIYPQLHAGQRFVLRASWPARAPVLAADGTDLTSAQAVAVSGSISLLTGGTAPATAAQAKALGPGYRAGDLIGQGGIEQAYQDQLAGRPALIIALKGPGRRAGPTVARFGGSAGHPVRTSIDMRVQRAASEAVRGASAAKPVDMVVVQPSTGRVLAMVERPGGFDRALEGEFPPGSTFKVVTASALAAAGLRPTSSVPCPSQANIGGRVFHNDHNEHLGTTSLLNAFAVSCNTTFALLATQRLGGSSLAAMAEGLGYNAEPALGLPGALAKFTTPHDPVDLAADAFGQGTDLVNPLSQATVTAAIEDGTWRPPQLVIDPVPRQTAHPRGVSPAILDTLRPMMRAVVTSGTAAGVGFPAGVYGKTGTAEYGTGNPPASHGWFIGYRGDMAFAVLVEGGGLGADSAGPVANAFLRNM